MKRLHLVKKTAKIQQEAHLDQAIIFWSHSLLSELTKNFFVLAVVTRVFLPYQVKL